MQLQEGVRDIFQLIELHGREVHRREQVVDIISLMLFLGGEHNMAHAIDCSNKISTFTVMYH